MSNFPTGAKLDMRVLWTIAQMKAQAPDVEAFSTIVTFYTLREYGMLDWSNKRHYHMLVERSIKRLIDAKLVEYVENGGGFQLGFIV